MRRTLALYGGGVLLLVIGAFPLAWMLSTALKPSGEIFATPPTLIPPAMTLENFGRLFTETNFLTYFGNSVLVSLATVLLTLASVGLAIPLFITFFETGLVPRLPTAILSTGLMLMAVLSFACGLILDTVTRGRRELKRMHYLTHSGVPMRGRRSTDKMLESHRR